MAKKRKRNKVEDLDLLTEPKEDEYELLKKAMDAIDQLSPEQLRALAGEGGRDAEHKSRPGRKSGKKPLQLSIDLHGMTISEAKSESKLRLQEALASAEGPISCEIITGRGRHSGQGGGVLYREVYQFVSKFFRNHIEKIDAPPSDTVISGVAFRGSFKVWLKRR